MARSKSDAQGNGVAHHQLLSVEAMVCEVSMDCSSGCNQTNPHDFLIPTSQPLLWL